MALKRAVCSCEKSCLLLCSRRVNYDQSSILKLGCCAYEKLEMFFYDVLHHHICSSAVKTLAVIVPWLGG